MIKPPKLIFLLCSALWIQSASAFEVVQTDQFVSSEQDVSGEEIWLSAQTVLFNGEASNDVFAAGASTIELNGRFHGDVWACTDLFSSAGMFHDGVRVLARSAQISGTLSGPLLVAAETVEVERTAILHDDALCLGETVLLNGSIGGDLRVFAQRVVLGGRINGDVQITAQDIVVLPDTILNGNLTYTAPTELVLSSSVLLGGDLKRTFDPAPVKRFFKPNLVGHFLFCMAALVAGLAFNALFPRYTGGACRALAETRGLCLLVGLAALVVLPVTAFILIFTILALPLSILTLLFYGILLYLARIVVALTLGAALLGRKKLTKKTVAAPLALGLVILYGLTSISAASPIITFLITVLGLGALLIALFKKPVLLVQAPDVFQQPTKEK